MSATSLVRPVGGEIYRLEDVDAPNHRRRISVRVSAEPLTVVDALELAEMLTLKARHAEKWNLRQCKNVSAR